MLKQIRRAAVCSFAIWFPLASATADGYGKPDRSYKSEPGRACAGAAFNGAYLGLSAGRVILASEVSDRDTIVWTGDYEATKYGPSVSTQLGRNWMHCNAMLGLEASVSWSGTDSLREFVAGPANAAIRNTVDWHGSLRARAGFMLDGAMLYATGGLAVANSDAIVSAPAWFGPGMGLDARNSSTRFGWVVGFGVEQALGDRVKIRSESLYYDFGSETFSHTLAGSTSRFESHQSMWVSQIGLIVTLGATGAPYHALK